jgi:trehalose-6-phosphate synthase
MYHSMHWMLNLNKLKNSYQVFKKNSRFCLMRKKKFKDLYNEYVNNFFWPKIFTIIKHLMC